MGKDSSLYQGVPCFPRHLASLSKVNEARGVGTVISLLAGNGEGDTGPCYVAYQHKSYKVFFLICPSSPSAPFQSHCERQDQGKSACVYVVEV